MKNHPVKRITAMLTALLLMLCPLALAESPASIVGTWECTQVDDILGDLLESTFDLLDLDKDDIPVDSILLLVGIGTQCKISLTFDTDNTFSLDASFSLLSMKEEVNVCTGRYEYRSGMLIIEGVCLPDNLYFDGDSLILNARLEDWLKVDLTFSRV